MIIGYARTSTFDQMAGFESQLKELEGVRQKVIRLAGERMTKTAIGGQLNIGEATVYRILAAAPKENRKHRMPQSEAFFRI